LSLIVVAIDYSDEGAGADSEQPLFAILEY
jgi:hypothetical protein